jgi:hypothetical protein
VRGELATMRESLTLTMRYAEGLEARIKELEGALEAIAREAERAKDIRHARLQIIGNIHLLVQRALDAREPA